MTETECDFPPADRATRLRRAMNFGAYIDEMARRYRYCEERRYWGEAGSKKRREMTDGLAEADHQG